MTVFIHIGLSKTGTKSIQRSFSLNADRLRRDRSLNYPSFAESHWPAALPFADEGTFLPLQEHVIRGFGTVSQARKWARRFQQEFVRDATRFDTHVLSSEQFAGMDVKTLSGLLDFVRKHHGPVKVIVYVRHPAERLSSMISQRLRAGQESLRTFRVHDDVLPTLHRFIELVGKDHLIIRRFGRQYFEGGTLLSDFMATIGQSPLAAGEALTLNESLSLPAMLIADRLYDIAPMGAKNRGPVEHLLTMGGPRFLAPRQMVEEAIAAYEGSTRLLEREFGVVFDAADLSKYPEGVPQALDGDAIQAIAVAMNQQALDIAGYKRDLVSPRMRDLARRVVGRVSRLAGKRA